MTTLLLTAMIAAIPFSLLAGIALIVWAAGYYQKHKKGEPDGTTVLSPEG